MLLKVSTVVMIPGELCAPTPLVAMSVSVEMATVEMERPVQVWRRMLCHSNSHPFVRQCVEERERKAHFSFGGGGGGGTRRENVSESMLLDW